MKLTDLITSYKDLLPEPSERYAEIIRIVAPENRPVVESFNLAAAVGNPESAPKLQPLDTVRIFGRYDFEAAPGIHGARRGAPSGGATEVRGRRT